MTGREAPSDAELKRNIQKRVLAAEAAELAKRNVEKRFNRPSIPGSRRPSSLSADDPKAPLNLKGNKKGKGQAQNQYVYSFTSEHWMSSNKSSAGTATFSSTAPVPTRMVLDSLKSTSTLRTKVV